MAQGKIYKIQKNEWVENYNIGQESGYSVLVRYGRVRQWVLDDAKIPAGKTTFNPPTLNYEDQPVTSFTHGIVRFGTSAFGLYWVRAGGTFGMQATTAGTLVCGTLTWIAHLEVH